MDPAKEKRASEETLQSLRKKWERGLEEKTVLSPARMFDVSDEDVGRKILVVLQDDEGTYHCHRYFELSHAWECSVDAQRVDLDTVWEWLPNPQAM